MLVATGWDQAYLLAGILTLAALTKLVALRAGATNSALNVLVRRAFGEPPQSALRALWGGVAACELGLAVALLTRAVPVVTSLIALAFAILVMSYLLWAVSTRQQAPCGCIGGKTAASWRSVGRAGELLVMAVAYMTAALGSQRPATAATAPLVLVMTTESAVFVALSDEIRPWLRQLRLEVTQLNRLLGIVAVGPGAVRSRIEKLPIWQEIETRAGERTDSFPHFVTSWRAGRWYLLEYESIWDGQSVTVVGAEYLGIYPPWTRLLVIEERDKEARVLATWDSARFAGISRTMQPVGPVSPSFT